MTDTDIATRLRGAASDSYGCQCVKCEAAKEIERLRAERDEARRMACEMEERVGCDESGCPKNGLARDHAKQRGWDCFKEDTDV